MSDDTRHGASEMVYGRVRMRAVRMLFGPGDSELAVKQKTGVVRFRWIRRLVDILVSVFGGW